MPLPLQGKLLRVLQDKEFEPLGSNRIVRADVRIIAATRPICPRWSRRALSRGPVLSPERADDSCAAVARAARDIEALAYAMLEDLSTQASGAGHVELQDDALRLLCSYTWPGNVRELRNTLERAVMLSDSERIDARALAPFVGSARAARNGCAIGKPECDVSPRRIRRTQRRPMLSTR